MVHIEEGCTPWGAPQRPRGGRPPCGEWGVGVGTRVGTREVWGLRGGGGAHRQEERAGVFGNCRVGGGEQT